MKMTLLQIVQNIMSAMDDDDVNSISDTVSSMQVAEEVRTAYYEILDGLNEPYEQGLVQLDPSGNPAKPTQMKLPDNVYQIEWIKYNYETNGGNDYHEVCYLDPEAFLHRMLATVNVTNTVPMVIDGVSFTIISDTDPHYYTSFNDKDVIFDSINLSKDTTLQASKTMCWGLKNPVFLMQDSYIPQLDPADFSLLLAEAKGACFINMKEVSNSKEDARARRQRVRGQNNRWKVGQQRVNATNYGRPTQVGRYTSQRSKTFSANGQVY